MQLSDIYKKLVSYFSTKSGLVNLSFYLMSAIIIWYFYDWKVLGVLVLFFLYIFTLSTFLSELYYAFKVGFKRSNINLIFSFIIVSLTFVGAYILDDLKILGYIVVLSVIITCVSIFSR